LRTLNLGILAHVDAGKTSLTERLLHHAGVIDRVGSVDHGDTHTDSLALERQRGITIKSAVVAFTIDDIAVNLIDTPGHPDFIAEVERVLGVLDGVVLVISAVEGVQPQTRVLMRTLRRLGIPTIFFVNKIDRRGADSSHVLAAIRDKLAPGVIAMGTTAHLGEPTAGFTPFNPDDTRFTAELLDQLTGNDDALVGEYLADENALAPQRLMTELASQVAEGLMHPVYFGSAVTGAGIEALAEGIRQLLPTASGEAAGSPHGVVFKVDRGAAGNKIAYLRLHSGTMRVRDRVVVGERSAKVTAIHVFANGADPAADRLYAGQIAKVWGLGDVRVNDVVGRSSTHRPPPAFAPPTLETVVAPRNGSPAPALYTALSQLAEQDPLINLRQDPLRGETVVSLYGEVQKEVIEATLAREFGVDVEFRRTTTICVERLRGTGEAVEVIAVDPNPFLATVGLRIAAAPSGTGTRFRLGVELGSMPLAFINAVEDTVTATLRQGLYGWQVGDCTVTLTRSGYWARQSHSHGSFDPRMSSTAGDFRNLTPLVVMAALREAGTEVHEPIHRFALELPAEMLRSVLPALSKFQAIPLTTSNHGTSCVVEGEIPAGQIHGLESRLPGLTSGDGVMEHSFARYRPVPGEVPRRARFDDNPLNRREYLLNLTRRTG
jgi:ribosomal protection tetracycline resistance protein